MTHNRDHSNKNTGLYAVLISGIVTNLIGPQSFDSTFANDHRQNTMNSLQNQNNEQILIISNESMKTIDSVESYVLNPSSIHGKSMPKSGIFNSQEKVACKPSTCLESRTCPNSSGSSPDGSGNNENHDTNYSLNPKIPSSLSCENTNYQHITKEERKKIRSEKKKKFRDEEKQAAQDVRKEMYTKMLDEVDHLSPQRWNDLTKINTKNDADDDCTRKSIQEGVIALRAESNGIIDNVRRVNLEEFSGSNADFQGTDPETGETIILEVKTLPSDEILSHGDNHFYRGGVNKENLKSRDQAAFDLGRNLIKQQKNHYNRYPEVKVKTVVDFEWTEDRSDLSSFVQSGVEFAGREWNIDPENVFFQNDK